MVVHTESVVIIVLINYKVHKQVEGDFKLY